MRKLLLVYFGLIIIFSACNREIENESLSTNEDSGQVCLQTDDYTHTNFSYVVMSNQDTCFAEDYIFHNDTISGKFTFIFDSVPKGEYQLALNYFNGSSWDTVITLVDTCQMEIPECEIVNFDKLVDTGEILNKLNKSETLYIMLHHTACYGSYTVYVQSEFLNGSIENTVTRIDEGVVKTSSLDDSVELRKDILNFILAKEKGDKTEYENRNILENNLSTTNDFLYIGMPENKYYVLETSMFDDDSIMKRDFENLFQAVSNQLDVK